jgi:arsenate reductase (thioredoxin)
LCGFRALNPLPFQSFVNLSTGYRKEGTMSDKISVLFICQHNSGRSQIAEAYLRRFAGDHLRIESAGLEPAPRINPLVVEVMKEEGIDLSGKKPQSVFDLFKAGKIYSHVITVCHDTENQCPIFPGITRRWHWPFPDPAKVEGSDEEKRAQVREIRDAIKNWLLEPGEGTFSFQALIQR